MGPAAFRYNGRYRFTEYVPYMLLQCLMCFFRGIQLENIRILWLFTLGLLSLVGCANVDDPPAQSGSAAADSQQLAKSESELANAKQNSQSGRGRETGVNAMHGGGQEETGQEEIGQEEIGQEENVRIGGIDWLVDYDRALAVARQQNKPVWLHFGENPG